MSQISTLGELKILLDAEERPGHSIVEWKIPDVLSVPTYVYCCYKSDSFEFAGQRWHLRFNPLSSFVSISKEASAGECSVHFVVSLKKSDGTLESKGEWSHTFAAPVADDFLCFPLLVSDLRSRAKMMTPSDGVTIIFSLKTVPLQSSAVEIATNQKPGKESHELAKACTKTQSENCIQKLSSDLSQVLLSGEDSDLTVRVKGVEFRLHRVIMGARTPVFSAMLKHNMKEKATGVVSIDDCEPEVFQAFVRYLYSGMVNELSTDTVFELFALADKYRVDELKSACLEFIRRSMSAGTFCDMLNLALTYDQTEILGLATEFFAQNMEDILQTVDWMNFMTDHLKVANELMLKAVKKTNSK